MSLTLLLIHVNSYLFSVFLIDGTAPQLFHQQRRRDTGDTGAVILQTEIHLRGNKSLVSGCQVPVRAHFTLA